ncbi:hypothetical protein HHK36_012955 [Tetracentron sinense]|uniref:Uncharacterized protein n=1 Tax=Tetracentron sinense TaxID=13715 RepID=A0A835DJ72_TETSI|nr:hypothetical protein HHK36_012955 [Tetracentron sinense]
MDAHILSFPYLVVTPSRPLRNPNFSPTLNPNLSAHFSCFSTRYRRSSSPNWDSNAENLRNERFKFDFGEESLRDDEDDADTGFRRRGKRRRWWSDYSSDINEGSGILEEVIDSVWIFKVFRAFGWVLPAIIISMLLANGPKAFLLALALPLGQSVLSLAIAKVWRKTRDSPKSRSSTRKKPFARATGNVEVSEEEKEEENSVTSKQRGSSYQSWVVADDGSVGKGGQRVPSFGGWDELDRQGENGKGPKKRPSRATGGPPRQQVEKKGKLSRRGRNKDTPLLLRLLIAVFPFLASWTKIF